MKGEERSRWERREGEGREGKRRGGLEVEKALILF